MGRIRLVLEFHKSKADRETVVSFAGGEKIDAKGKLERMGIPFTGPSHVLGTPEGDAFEKFQEAAHEFCKSLIELGEL